MAEKCGFFNSNNGDRKYKAEFFAEYFASFIANGVFPNPSTGCQVMANGDMTVTVKTGKAWINGFYYHNDSDLILPIDVADGVLKRIDRIVLQYSTIDRTIKAVVRKGAFGSAPEAPVMQRNADAYELAIADITVDNGVISISQAAINDLRLSETYCGISHCIVDHVETETLFLQYQKWYIETTEDAETDLATFKSQFQAEFVAWFNTIKGILDTEMAGHLLLLIQQNAANIAINADKITTGILTPDWIGDVIPVLQTINNANVTATNTVEISLAPVATEAETLAWDDLNLKDGGQTAGSFTLKCWGTPNLINIPVVIAVRGA
ncbi:hypothetical protein LNN31_18795 [Acetobacterium wieringae]|uniref:DUF2184 domain-containing protein n=1 Tax=Acetobacterium wieringae TaxID=52694 RepID=A0ABY6HER3_9FIRM|nr:hypothetical protein [Acetobacterium wieringae]UYO62790.1 hypothetical protein LNN31_18795 [Acetobacterium wieringae]